MQTVSRERAAQGRARLEELLGRLKDRRLRPRLIDLLIDIENRQARMSRSGGVGHDVSWLWKELGLRRP